MIINEICESSPKALCKYDAVIESTVIDTTSPIEAANGVARLSGFILNLCETIITETRTKSVNMQKFYINSIDFKKITYKFTYLKGNRLSSL